MLQLKTRHCINVADENIKYTNVALDIILFYVHIIELSTSSLNCSDCR